DAGPGHSPFSQLLATSTKRGGRRQTSRSRLDPVDHAGNTILDFLGYVVDSVDVAEKKQLSGVLNLRVDEALSNEIERIAVVSGSSGSEAARKLLGYGVEVQRQIEASYLRLPYSLDMGSARGR